MTSLEERLRRLFSHYPISFEEIHHDSSETCSMSAKARGRGKKIGGKTLLLKDKGGFRLFTMSAILAFDNQKARHLLGSQKLRFATKDELWELTGAVSGALPPFGRPLQDLDYYIDQSVLDNDEIAFNAGVLTCSFIMNTQDWYGIVKDHATVASFTKEAPQT
jgi:Ala-tRNA(Pro) deacylase